MVEKDIKTISKHLDSSNKRIAESLKLAASASSENVNIFKSIAHSIKDLQKLLDKTNLSSKKHLKDAIANMKASKDAIEVIREYLEANKPQQDDDVNLKNIVSKSINKSGAGIFNFIYQCDGSSIKYPLQSLERLLGMLNGLAKNAHDNNVNVCIASESNPAEVNLSYEFATKPEFKIHDQLNYLLSVKLANILGIRLRANTRQKRDGKIMHNIDLRLQKELAPHGSQAAKPHKMFVKTTHLA